MINFFCEKKIESYNETIFHLVNFRVEQFKQSKLMLGIDCETFMIFSVIGSHYLKIYSSKAKDWDAVWALSREKKIGEFYNKKKLTIFAVSNILNLPKETVRKKIDILKKKNLLVILQKLDFIQLKKLRKK